MPLKNQVEEIYMHCSASPWGDAMVFDNWHKQRGWTGIGYHFVILNGRPKADVRYWAFLDGQIQPGRHLNDDAIFSDAEMGAHVAGRNSKSIGFCLVGNREFTEKQLVSAKVISLALLKHFNLPVSALKGHYEDINSGKTCPNIEMNAFRDFVSDKIDMYALYAAIDKYIEEFVI